MDKLEKPELTQDELSRGDTTNLREVGIIRWLIFKVLFADYSGHAQNYVNVTRFQDKGWIKKLHPLNQHESADQCVIPNIQA